MGDHTLPTRAMSEEVENAGKRGPEGKEGRMGGLRGRGSSGVWRHGGLEHRRTRPLGFVHVPIEKPEDLESTVF